MDVYDTVFTECLQHPILPPMNIILFHEWPSENRIPADDFRGEHIRKVLRLIPSDSFVMGIVNGDWGIATITAMDKNYITYSFELKGSAQPLHPVTLLVAQVRPICMKRILREAVSLGVEELIVVGADTAERSYASAKLWSTGEYQKYLLDGAMQSGKTAMPHVSLIESVDVFCGDLNRWKSRILLDNTIGGTSLAQADVDDVPVVLAIGPERGWSERERNLFISSNFTAHSLGPRVLRTETACSAGLGVLLGRMGLL